MDNAPIKLSLEHQFSIRSFESQVQKMNEAETKEFLCNFYEEMLLRQKAFEKLLAKQWGMQ